MIFINSILNTFYKLADLRSRSQRKELIFYILFLIGLGLIVGALDIAHLFSGTEKLKTAVYIIQDAFFVISIISLIPLICLSIRRLHDVNLSGAYIGVPIVVDLSLRFLGYTDTPLEIGVRLIIIISLLSLCFYNSDQKDNQYGKLVK